MTHAVLIYGGRHRRYEDDVAVVPIQEALFSLYDLLIKLKRDKKSSFLE